MANGISKRTRRICIRWKAQLLADISSAKVTCSRDDESHCIPLDSRCKSSLHERQPTYTTVGAVDSNAAFAFHLCRLVYLYGGQSEH